MGKASISIAVTATYNGSALEKAERRLDSLSKKAVAASGNLDTAGGKLVSSGFSSPRRAARYTTPGPESRLPGRNWSR